LQRQCAAGKTCLRGGVIECVEVSARPFRSLRAERSPRAVQTGPASGLITLRLVLAALARTTIGTNVAAWVIGFTSRRKTAEGVSG